MNKQILITILALSAGMWACKTKPQDDFEKFDADTEWELALVDPCTDDWRTHWFLDGEIATVENSDSGMDFSAGPINRNDAHHAVLWTKQSFEGDVKIEYDFTRTDEQVVNVNILFIQATGTGEGQFSKDITEWNDYRKVPTMSKYWLNMNTIHISYAAFPMVNEDPTNDYIRVRKYPAQSKETFGETEVPPSFDKTELFLPGITYHMTWVKTDGKLFLKVEGDEKEKLYQWDLTGFEPVVEGRIGLRHMFTRSGRYKDFKVYTK
ncbi:YesU family protein [Reichenbachiella agarivorans]|uniref:YesU family protein n=1 Tax=Reichenbachiella agarivorans TaxID=2979464 RepID=A0ABY6CQ48_9BACT|nr:YesU family protein [Reichenbachiella agarivorans]UXP32643.1 YesU family protein [Reichenbachiella agarivorans]